MPSITGLISKYVLGHEEEKEAPPPITTSTAVTFLVIYTLIYVIPFYLSSWTRPSPNLSRDAPSVIRARIASVTLTCVVCSLSTFYVLTNVGNARASGVLHSMGYWPLGLVDMFKTLLLTAALFIGPLFEALVAQRGWKAWARLEPLKELMNEWTTWRNIVAGPVTEEVLFRSAAVPLMLLARSPVTETIFLSPVVFGLAHIHHFYEFRLTNPQVPAAAALLRSVLQLAYTTLFGAYATFLFLRTGSLLAICAIHAFCNCMGLPRVWGRVQRAGRDGVEDPKTSPVGWTVVYYVLLVTGAGVWYKNLWPLTESPYALVSM